MTEWYDNEGERKAFLALVNCEGYVLEESIREMLSEASWMEEYHLQHVIDRPLFRGGGRVEIDIWFRKKHYVFLIEAKRSDYDWVFLRNIADSDDIHLICGTKTAVKAINTNRPFVGCSSRAVEVLEEDQAPKLIKNNKGKTGASLPVRSSREELVHEAVRQALFNLETLIHYQLDDPSWVDNPERVFIPIIVTNARLLSAIYKREGIDSNAILTKFDDIKPIQFVAMNHAEVLRWGTNFEHKITNKGLPPSGALNITDNRFKGSYLKSVFVVEKDSLLNLINKISVN